MSANTWIWAQLDEQQVKALHEAEESLGAGYVLAYRAGQEAHAPAALPGLRAAALTASQLECLQGLETQLNATLVAYAK